MLANYLCSVERTSRNSGNIYVEFIIETPATFLATELDISGLPAFLTPIPPPVLHPHLSVLFYQNICPLKFLMLSEIPLNLGSTVMPGSELVVPSMYSRWRVTSDYVSAKADTFRRNLL